MSKSLVGHHYDDGHRNAYPVLEAHRLQDGPTPDRRTSSNPEAAEPLPKLSDADVDKRRRPEAAREL